MNNRRRSITYQAATVAVLASIWIIKRAAGKGKQPADSSAIYQLNHKRKILFSVLLLLADLYAIPAVLRGKKAIDTEELKDILLLKAPRRDRVALYNMPEKRAHYKRISDNALKAIIALPLIMLIDKAMRKDAGTLGILYLWMHAITYTIYSFSPLGPAFVDKYRPVVYYPGIPEAERILGNNRNASYSGHTGSAACTTFFMAKVYIDYHPELSVAARNSLYMLAYAPPLLVGWLRTKALKHFPTDVIQAILIGGCCGIMIPGLYKE